MFLMLSSHDHRTKVESIWGLRLWSETVLLVFWKYHISLWENTGMLPHRYHSHARLHFTGKHGGGTVGGTVQGQHHGPLPQGILQAAVLGSIYSYILVQLA